MEGLCTGGGRARAVAWGRRMQQIAIIGVGLIGGSLGLAFRKLGLAERVVGIGRQETLEQAQSLGAIDHGWTYEQMAEGLKGAQAVFVCTPILRIIELIPHVAKAAEAGAVVTDVGSTKVAVMRAAARAFPKGVTFVGGHPMAGSEERGVSAADPFLFQNAVYVLTPPRRGGGKPLEALVGLIEQLGARVAMMPAEVHDRLAGVISHLPQMMAVSLVEMAGRLNEVNPLVLRLAAGGFRDMTRIASSPYDVWRDICATNAEQIRGTIDTYVAELQRLKGRIGDESLEEDFQYANKARGAIPRDSKGFLRPLHEVLVVVEDKPGVIAGISVPLAAAKINIKDIEVLKVREDEGGSLRLAFGTQADAEQAVAILRERGYAARLR